MLTSFHQSALPTALLLRLAGIGRIAACSTDYPGALLDVRIPEPADEPEPVRMLRIVAAAGYRLPAGDAGELAITMPLPEFGVALPADYLVLHAWAAAPARTCSPEVWSGIVAELSAGRLAAGADRGPAEAAGTARLAAAATGPVSDLGGQLDLAQLAAVLQRARAVVVGNTGPAHLAAAVGTPVVSLFAPVVPAARWAPFTRSACAAGRSACRLRRQPGAPLPGRRASLPGLDHRRPGAGRARPARRASAVGAGGDPMRILLWHVHGSWTTAFVQGSHDYFVPVTPDRGPYGLGRARTWQWPSSVVELPPAELADTDFDLVLLQRPEELELCRRWLRRTPGRRAAGDLPGAQHAGRRSR